MLQRISIGSAHEAQVSSAPAEVLSTGAALLRGLQGSSDKHECLCKSQSRCKPLRASRLRPSLRGTTPGNIADVELFRESANSDLPAPLDFEFESMWQQRRKAWSINVYSAPLKTEPRVTGGPPCTSCTMAYVRRGADPPASQRGDSGTLRATRQALFSQNFWTNSEDER